MSNEITTKQILEMLEIVIIEIRAGDRLDYSSKMSDVFHHVPGLVAKEFDPQYIYEDMRGIAIRNGVEEYLDKLLNHVRKIELR